MADDKSNGPIVTYLIPIVVGLLLMAVGYIHGLLKMDSLLFAVLLILVIGLSIFLSELLLTRTSRLAEREQNFAFLSKVLFRHQTVETQQVLSFEEVLALEQTASEVWVYAYDMKWEDGNSTLPDVVCDNLKRGTRYRYIVPHSSKVAVRVQALLAKYSTLPDRDALIQFKTRTHELKLVQFGITIYNPVLTSHDRNRAQECVVVFFPHYEGLGTTTPEARQFLALRGRASVEVQEGFLEAWEVAQAFIDQPKTLSTGGPYGEGQNAPKAKQLGKRGGVRR